MPEPTGASSADCGFVPEVPRSVVQAVERALVDEVDAWRIPYVAADVAREAWRAMQRESTHSRDYGASS
jgi:hypothetical protein